MKGIHGRHGMFLRVILCYILVAVLMDFNNTKEKKLTVVLLCLLGQI